MPVPVEITNAGICAYKNNRVSDAENYFRRALAMQENNPVALLQMSQLSYDQDNVLSARGYLQRYLAIARHTPASLWLGIRIERELGDKDTLSSYKLALRNNFPNSREADLLDQSETDK